APATLTVNSLADNTTDTSVLTLRDAVVLVNNAGAPSGLGQATMPDGWAAQVNTVDGGNFGTNDTIRFAPSLVGAALQTITLGGTALALTRSVFLNGPGANRLAVSGNNASQVVTVAPGVTAA